MGRFPRCPAELREVDKVFHQPDRVYRCDFVEGHRATKHSAQNGRVTWDRDKTVTGGGGGFRWAGAGA